MSTLGTVDPVVLAARNTLATHARTFRLASRFLPAAARDDAAVVYAFCRTVDDAADELASLDELAALDAELRGDMPARPLVAAFLQVVRKHDIPIRAAHELIEGCRSDLGSVRIRDRVALIRYAYLVAGTVGLMMAPLIGVRDPAALEHAVDLGIAMQLTNIARDVAEDAGRERVYLPATWLRRAGLSAELPDVAVDADRLHVVVRKLVDLAEVYYRSGEQGLRAIPLRSRIAIAVAARVYRGIGLAVVARGPSALASRTVLSSRERLWWALDGVRLATIGLPTRSSQRPAEPVSQPDVHESST